MKVLLLTNLKKPNIQRIKDYIESLGDKVTLTEDEPSKLAFSDYDVGVSYSYRHILKPIHFRATRLGIVNCHISLLPYNRGADPATWALYGSTPAGVTLHWIDEGVDTGPIILQKEVEVRATDTAQSLYERLTHEMENVFKGGWAMLRSMDFKYGHDNVQPPNYPTHTVKDGEALCDLEQVFGPIHAQAFVNALRAQTKADRLGAYIHDAKGNKVYVKVNLSYG